YGLKDGITLHRGERLVLVSEVRQVRGCGPNIRKFDYQVLNDFLLDAEAPLLNTRSLEMRIDDEHRGLDDGLGGVRENLIDDRELSFANELRGTRRVTREIEPRIGIHGRVEDTRAAANDGLVVAESGAPGKAEARGEVGLVSEDKVM